MIYSLMFCFEVVGVLAACYGFVQLVSYAFGPIYRPVAGPRDWDYDEAQCLAWEQVGQELRASACDWDSIDWTNTHRAA